MYFFNSPFLKPAFTLLFILLFAASEEALAQRKFGLVIHGGAGWITPGRYTPEEQTAYETKLQEALEAGYKVLENDGSAEEAVVVTITILENSPLFNSAKGAVLNHEGAVEMDASIMRGSDKNAGAVAGVRQVRNPILAAQAVMNESNHVMLAGAGADSFAVAQGLAQEDPDYFVTPHQRETLERILKEEQQKESKSKKEDSTKVKDKKHGTVGCVALDKQGNLAAGTSTGGMMNKKHNRIGDSPVIGAGTYANNRSCAVSCTGHGEFFIRLAVAHEVSALMMYRNWDVAKAAMYVIHNELESMEAVGGLIAIDRRGNISMPFNTPGMFRGYKLSTGEGEVLMYK